MSDYPMLISNKLHSFRNFPEQMYTISFTLRMGLKEKTSLSLLEKV